MATQEYDKNNTTRFNLKLNNKTDADIIERLDEVENVQGYIKAIIRNEMEGAREMKKFERKTSELYGAKRAGYRFDRFADREMDEQLIRKLRAERGERFVDDKLDALYDFDGDLYQDENGDFYAVVFVWDHDHEVPLCWQKLVVAEYHIKPEFAAMWGEDVDDETIVTGIRVAELAEEWDKSVDELLEQLEIIQPKRISIDNGAHWVEPAQAVESMDWDVIVSMMEDEAREQVSAELAPCGNVEFLERYLYVAKNNLIIG